MSLMPPKEDEIDERLKGSPKNICEPKEVPVCPKCNDDCVYTPKVIFYLNH